MRILLVIVGDIAVFYIALFVALSMRMQTLVAFDFYAKHILPFSILVILWMFLNYMFGLYDRIGAISAQKLFNTLSAVSVLFAVFGIIMFYFLPFVFELTPKVTLLLFIFTLFVINFFWRLYMPRIMKFTLPKALLVGDNENIAGFDIVNVVPSNISPNIILGAIRGMSEGKVLIRFSDPNIKSILPKLHTLMLGGVTFIDLDSVLEEQNGCVDLDHVDELWFLKHTNKISNRLFLFGKRFVDILFALLLVPVFIIVFPFVWLAIKIEDGGDVLFKQLRYGFRGKPFYIYKFRTMTGIDTQSDVKKTKHKVTKTGAFLRQTRIDELPQIWNILKGDLSFIGPRPEIVSLAKEYERRIPFYSVRHMIRPGLTGWAQVTHMRDPHHKIDIDATKEKLGYDLFYIKNLSMFLELKIILKTIRVVLSKIFIKTQGMTQLAVYLTHGYFASLL